MKMIEFQGADDKGSVRSVFPQQGTDIVLADALAARGYRVKANIHQNPWAEHEKLIAVSGRLTQDSPVTLLFLAPDDVAAELVDGALRLSYPQRKITKETVERPA